MYDIVSSFNVSNINRIRKTGSPGVTIVVTTPITASNSNTNVFALPYTAIKEVAANVVYNTLLFRSGEASVANTVTFTIPDNHILADNSPGAFILTINGVLTAVTANASGGTPGNTSVTLTTTAAAGATFNVIVPTKVTVSAIEKTLENIKKNVPIKCVFQAYLQLTQPTIRHGV